MSIYLLIFYDKKKMEIFNDRIVIWLNPHHKWARVYKEFMSLLTPLSHQKTKPFLEGFFFPICTIFFWRDFAPLSKAKLSKVVVILVHWFFFFFCHLLSVCVLRRNIQGRCLDGWHRVIHSFFILLLFFGCSLSLSSEWNLHYAILIALYMCVFHWYLEEVKVMVTYRSIRPTLSICFNLLSQESSIFIYIYI